MKVNIADHINSTKSTDCNANEKLDLQASKTREAEADRAAKLKQDRDRRLVEQYEQLHLKGEICGKEAAATDERTEEIIREEPPLLPPKSRGGTSSPISQLQRSCVVCLKNAKTVCSKCCKFRKPVYYCSLDW